MDNHRPEDAEEQQLDRFLAASDVRSTTSGVDLPPKRPGRLRALALISGGLDSAIAVKMMQEQGIEVVGINFYTGFCVTEQKARLGRHKKSGEPVRSDAKRLAEDLELPLDIVDISADYLPMVTNPKYGYGKNVNPCVDCRIFMLKKAKDLMEEYQADFIITGEVIGQRPKSQMRLTQKMIEKKAGLEGLLLRPLSAQGHAPTPLEQKGKIDRQKLGAINGRSRKPQYDLAAKYGINDYASPAGGCCFLADETYALKFQDFIADQKERHPERPPALDMEDVVLMGMGRHFRIRPGLKLICGRNEDENNAMQLYRNRRYFLFSELVKGPSGLVITEQPDAVTPEEYQKMASILGRYGQGRQHDWVRLILSPPLRSLSAQDLAAYKKYAGDEENPYPWQSIIRVRPATPAQCERYILKMQHK